MYVRSDDRFALTMVSPKLSKAAADSTYVAKRLALSFGKAAWIASTSFLIMFVPLIIEMDREQQMIEMEKGELNVLTSSGAAKAT